MDIKKTNEYLTEKSQSDNENDFLSRLIFLLRKDGQHYNSHFYNQNKELKEAVETCDSDIKEFLERVINSIDSKKIDLGGVIEVLGEIKKAQSLNESEIKKSLAAVIRKNDDSLFEGLREFASSILKNQELFDEKISSNSLDIANQSKEISSNLVEMAKHIQKISIKYPSKMEVFGSVEIKKPSWWKSFEFSWEPINELFEKIKSHTFKVNVENQIKFDEKILKNLPEDVAQKISKAVADVLKDNLPKITIGGGGGGVRGFRSIKMKNSSDEVINPMSEEKAEEIRTSSESNQREQITLQEEIKILVTSIGDLIASQERSMRYRPDDLMYSKTITDAMRVNVENTVPAYLSYINLGNNNGVTVPYSTGAPNSMEMREMESTQSKILMELRRQKWVIS